MFLWRNVSASVYSIIIKERSSTTSGTAADTNGYKDVWNATTGASAAQSTGSSVPVRPSACTPDSRVSGYIDAAASSPASRTGSTVGSGTAAAWNANCGIGTPSAQTATSGLHQSNHTFYPWMAIAGESPPTTIIFCLHLSFCVCVFVCMEIVYLAWNNKNKPRRVTFTRMHAKNLNA